MIFAKKKKCRICDVKYPEDAAFHEMRIGTVDGTITLEICDECANFFDKSADVLRKRRKNESVRLRNEHQSDQEELDEWDGE